MKSAWRIGAGAWLNGVKWGCSLSICWMHQPDSIRTPETCRLFASLVKAHLGTPVRTPTPALF